MQCRAGHQQTPVQQIFVDVDWTVTVINQRRLPPLITLHSILCQRTVVDADHRDGWAAGDFSTSRKTQLLSISPVFGGDPVIPVGVS